jgi:phosphoenolpyruvate synthase/pyruvate phosphate dikinase
MNIQTRGQACLRLGSDPQRAEPPAEFPVGMGAKAGRLDWLLGHGLPVPPSCCILTEAYDCYLLENDALELERELWSALPDETARGELADLAYAYEIPSPLKTAVEQTLAETIPVDSDRPLLAVRSSASDEDGSRRSFAGQYLSRLGVSPSGLWSAVRACWASAWSPEATRYRGAERPAGDPPRVAVLLQPALDADVSVVVFTRGHGAWSDAIVINASWGLGEGIVSGGVSADTYMVDRESLRLNATEQGEKAFKVVICGAGGTERVPVNLRRLCLHEREVLALARLALEVEALLGVPADVEAAWAAGRWHLLQGRPITTLAATLDTGLRVPTAPPAAS